MNKRHKWADVAIAFAEGNAIQFVDDHGHWWDWDSNAFPDFLGECIEWRVKPVEPVVMWLWAYEAMLNAWTTHHNFMTEKRAEEFFSTEPFAGCKYIKTNVRVEI